MPYRIAGIDVHKRMLAVVIADVAVEGDYEFESRQVGTRSLRGRRFLKSAPKVLFRLHYMFVINFSNQNPFVVLFLIRDSRCRTAFFMAPRHASALSSMPGKQDPIPLVPFLTL
jgi:hypothetical protein